MSAAFFVLAACLLFSGSVSAVPDSGESVCETPEPCYRDAVALAGSTGSTGTVNGDRVRAALDRLELVRERHPGSVWARRAGLLMGVLLTDRDPADAVRFLRAAQRDLPVIEDYVRLWMAESLLRLGEAARAAVLFEFIPEAVPDTLLGPRVAYRAGAAWYQAAQCARAVDWLARAVSAVPQDPAAPGALLNLADCQIQAGQPEEARTALLQLWARYPHTQEAREAEVRLGKVTGGSWRPSPDDLFGRAQAYLALSFHEEAVADLQKFLAAAPNDPRRGEGKLKLGIALVRLKRYDQARRVFQELVAERAVESGEAAVWLARVHLRQGDGEQLVALSQSLGRVSASGEQKATVLGFVANWYDDQGKWEPAIQHYRSVAQADAAAGQRAEALWRIGWIHYRTGRYREAVETLQDLAASKDDGQLAPRALYWAGRARERQSEAKAAELYRQLCRRYPYTYYCQLARSRVDASTGEPVPVSGPPALADGSPLLHDVHARRAAELKLLGLDQEAAREWGSLVERYARDRDVLVALSSLLSEAGAHYQALRLARLYFKDALERGGDAVPLALWPVAYPTAYLPTIRENAGGLVDPYLAAAIIREESQYDPRAVSRVGAVGLMQVMPDTAQAVARRRGMAAVGRDELFDQETNIRVGVRYLEQLLQQFSGNVMHAVAAYNAGPQAVTGWIAKNGARDADEFVELIPYQETRLYVKRVLRSYREYRRLGGAACGPRFLDKVC
ncbi:MAG: transglycosylase SLT domain-containing protein [Nitrospirota bacterium]